jgi:hypothetical protein
MTPYNHNYSPFVLSIVIEFAELLFPIKISFDFSWTTFSFPNCGASVTDMAGHA